MRDLIYINSNVICLHDNELLNNPIINRWNSISRVDHAGSFVRPRVGPGVIPAPMSKPLCEIPRSLAGTGDFGQAIESVMSRLDKQFKDSDREIFVSWSGGIDSTAILVAYLKTMSPEVLERTKVLCNYASIEENPFFYYTFIDGRIPSCDTCDLAVTNETVGKYYIIDGEGGNQCHGSYWSSVVRNHHCTQLLFNPWRDVKNFEKFFPTSPKESVREWVELIKNTIPYSPVEINTLYDFFWWANFNTKFEEVLFRKLLTYTLKLDTKNTKIAGTETFVRPFAEPEIQIWSLLSLEDRAKMFDTDPKYYFKKYIYDFDGNHHYFINKLEQGSLWYPAGWQSDLNMLPIFAIDNEWNKYHLGAPESRKFLGEFLENLEA